MEMEHLSMLSKTRCLVWVFLLILGFGLSAWADRPTTITLNPARGVYGGSTSLQATLMANKNPIANAAIRFTIANGAGSGTAVTNSSGIATLNGVSLTGISVGVYSDGIAATFAGDGNLRASRATASLTVEAGTGGIKALYAYVTDKSVYMPDYQSAQPPAVGAEISYLPGLFTAVKRITDSMHTPDAASGAPSVVTITTEYSTMTAFNEDNTRLILIHLSYFALYDGAGNFLNNLPFEINASAEPRWSRRDPNVLYYLRGNQIKQYNVATNTASVVHTFDEYSAVSGKGKSDISFDGDHFVLVGDGRYVFIYELSSDSKSSVFDSAGMLLNSVAITPNGNVTIAWNGVGSDRFQGIELFDANMNFIRQVARADGHADVTRDTNGDELMVWANANDPRPICNNGVVKIRLADGLQTCLATFDWSLAFHISATDNSGWVFVETYAPGDPIPPSGWFAYTDELMQVKLDGSQIRRFAHHLSRPFNSYTYQPKLSISRDGRKLAFASNFGLQQTLGNPTEYSDVYTVDTGIVSIDTLGTAY
jgi:hypothetical protein